MQDVIYMSIITKNLDDYGLLSHFSTNKTLFPCNKRMWSPILAGKKNRDADGNGNLACN